MESQLQLSSRGQQYSQCPKMSQSVSFCATTANMHNPVSNTPLLQSTPNFVHGDVDQAAFYQHLQQPVSIYGPPSVKGEVLQGPIQTVQKSEKNLQKQQKDAKI